MRLKPLIKEINIGTVDRNLDMDPIQLLSLREGDFFETQRLKQDIGSLQKRLDSMGYPQNSYEMNVQEINEKVTININITLGKPRIFKKILSNSSSLFINDFLKKKFLSFYNKPFEMTRFKLYLDDAQKELFNYGYYLISLDFLPILKKQRVILDIKVSQDKLFAFDFKNLKQEHREVIHQMVKDLFRKYKRPLTDAVLKMAIEDHYKFKALLNAHAKIELQKFRNRFNEDVTLYRIFLEENQKTRLEEVNFLGNSFFDRSTLKSMFNNEAFELAKSHFYDEEYFNFFNGFLKTKYIENGFVQVKVNGPNKILDKEKTTASIEYVIHEGQRAYVRSLVFEGLPHEIETLALTKIVNRPGTHFNPVAMAEDLKMVTNLLQDKGYYFAEIINSNDDSLVTYSKSGADVDIRYIVTSGPVLRLNRVIYLGNNKTRKEVLTKKILLIQGDIITPRITREFETNLSATGLFNTVSVLPMKHVNKSNASTDLIVKVTERDYGLVEFAPGFRTDLGAKLTATASYLNIGGMNRAITLRSQVNQRLNYQTFDPRRRKQRRQLVEHNETLTYTQGDIFNTQINSSTGLSYQYKRFYSFDAEIFRVNNTFTRDISTRLSSSVRYQYEAITQSDATELRDNGSFKIGAITPSLTYDLRNSQVNPLKGAFFNLSCEFANPYFLSQKESDLTINYYKLVSRNRFYIPYKFGTVAISMVAGLQENLANEKITVNGVEQTAGYIPNIKVFRLTGMDIVRGFNDEEINRVPGEDKSDVSQVKVEQKAYLANLKFEPRYFINDTLMAGVFYDAGRVFVNQVNMGQLRDSVGVTFKILTPVGTLDFDYGIKLLRERNKDGSLEDPGRFHVSIGFF
jgi:outer membrane protein insertion porin family